MSENLPNRTLPVSKAASFLGVSAETLRRWDRKGVLKPFRTKGGQRRYSLTNLEAYKSGERSAKTPLKISQAAERLGVHPETLRRWERDGAIQAERTNGGQRRYTLDRLEQIASAPTVPIPVRTMEQCRPQPPHHLRRLLAVVMGVLIVAGLWSQLSPLSRERLQRVFAPHLQVPIVDINDAFRYKLNDSQQISGLKALFPLEAPGLISQTLTVLKDSVMNGARFLGTVFFGQNKDWYIKPTGDANFKSIASGEGDVTNLQVTNLTVTGTTTGVTGTGGGAVTGGDADTLEGQAGSYYLDLDNETGTCADCLTGVEIDESTLTGIDADTLNGQIGSYYLDSANFAGTDWTDLTDGGESALHIHDHGDLNGLGDDDHPQYAALAQNEIVSGAWRFSNDVMISYGSAIRLTDAIEDWDAVYAGLGSDTIIDAMGDIQLITQTRIATTAGNPDALLHVTGGDAYIAPDSGYTFDNPSVNEDLYVFGNLEVDGTVYGTVSGDLTCSDCLTGTEIDESTLAGVDADLLDGQDGTYYLDLDNETGTCADCLTTTEIDESTFTGLGSTNIDDIYLFNTGDTASGDYNFDANTFVIDSVADIVGVGAIPVTERLEVTGNIKLTTIGDQLLFVDDGYIKSSADNTIELQSAGTTDFKIADRIPLKIQYTDTFFFSNANLEKTGTATVATQYPSYDLILKGSGWDETSAADADLTGTIRLTAGSGATGSIPYRIGIFDDTPTEWVTFDLLNQQVGIGDTTPSYKLDVDGDIRSTGQLISTVAIGTAPLAVTSTTLVTNLNADSLDDQTGSYYLDWTNFTNTPTVLSSLDGVSNDEGDIDLVEGANITITPSDLANTITFDVAGGSGSSLDADLLDGQDGSYYLDLDNETGTCADCLTGAEIDESSLAGVDADLLEGQAGSFYLDDFDDVYANSITAVNFDMEIDNANGLTFDMTTTGDFIIRDAGNNLFTFGDNSIIDIRPANVATTAGRVMIDGAVVDSTTDLGLLDINMDSLTTTASGINLDFQVLAAAANLTMYGQRVDLTVDSDATYSHTAYGQYVAVDLDDASSTAYGLYVDADADADGVGTELAFGFETGDSSTTTEIEVGRMIRNTSGTAAAGIGAYSSTYIEDAAGALFEAGRVGFRASDVTSGASSAAAFMVYTERETFTNMIPAFTAYVTGADRLLCMNGTDGAVSGWDCFGMTIGSANAVTLNFDGTGRLKFDYSSGSAQVAIFTPNTADDLLLKTLGSQEISFDTSNNGTDMYIASGGGIGMGTIGPDRKLDVLDATNPQLRLTDTDGTDYVDFQADENGALTITTAGGDTSIVNVTGSVYASKANTTRYSYFGDEFTKRALTGGADSGTTFYVTADSAPSIDLGDTGAWGFDENTSGYAFVTDDLINGLIAVTVDDNVAAGSHGAMIYVADAATLNNADLQWKVANKPIYVGKFMKATTNVSADHCFFAGLSSQTTANSGADCTTGASNSLIGFQNTTATLQAVVGDASAETVLTCSGATIVVNQSFWVRFEVFSSASVKFWYDMNVDDGAVNESYCGEITTGIPSAAMGAAIATASSDAANADAFYGDYVRIWQDDQPSNQPLSIFTLPSPEVPNEVAVDGEGDAAEINPDGSTTKIAPPVVEAEEGIFQKLTIAVEAIFKKIIADTAEIVSAFVKDLTVDQLTVSDKTSGQAMIVAGSKQLTINNSQVTETSKVFVTFRDSYAPAANYWVSDVTAGESFTVTLDQPTETESRFDYWIVN